MGKTAKAGIKLFDLMKTVEPVDLSIRLVSEFYEFICVVEKEYDVIIENLKRAAK